VTASTIAPAPAAPTASAAPTYDLDVTNSRCQAETTVGHGKRNTCGAQAFVAVEIHVTSSTEPLHVLYCAHHYGKHAPGLAQHQTRVLADLRHTINAKPTDPTDSNGF
jgi:hypothetical protein